MSQEFSICYKGTPPSPYDKVLKRNAGEMANAVKHAEAQNNHKARLISWSWYFLIAGLGLVVVFIILFTTNGVDAP
jgi:hypothetical protein